MKIYLFNPETGVYMGEDYADEAPMRQGTFIIPADATTIPPPRVGPGEAPVFRIREQRWEVEAVSALRRMLARGSIEEATPSEDSP